MLLKTLIILTAITQAQIGACWDDVHKFCEATLPLGYDDIKGCMVSHRSLLSQACRDALDQARKNDHTHEPL